MRLAFLAAFLLSPILTFAQSTTQPAAIDPADQKILDQKISISIAGSFFKAVEVLRKASGANIYIDWHALDSAGIEPDAPVKVTERDTAFSELLTVVLNDADANQHLLSFGIFNGINVISTKDGIDKFRTLRAGHTKEQGSLTAWLPMVVFRSNSFSDAIKFMSDVTAFEIDADWDSLEKSGIRKDAPITMQMKKAQFGAMLQLIGLEAGGGKVQLDYRVDGKRIEFFAVTPAGK